MKFSLILCTYNQADSLKVTLEGLKHQNNLNENCEVIVVDNNSNDHTKEVCEKTFADIPFSCRYIYEPRQGLSAARNRGATEAQGDYLIFTDDDAGLPSDWLANYETAYATNNADCIFGRISVDWEKGQPKWYSSKFGPMFVELNYGDTALKITDHHHEFFGKNFSLRRNLLLELGGFDENLGRKGDRLFVGEETRIYRWLISSGRHVMYCPEIIVYHRLKDHEYTEEHCYKHSRDSTISEYYMLKTGGGRKLLGRPLYAARKALSELCNFGIEYLLLNRQSNYGERFFVKIRLTRAWLLLELWLTNKAT